MSRSSAAPTVTLVDRSSHNPISTTQPPGSLVALKVTYTVPFGTDGDWYRTSYAFDGGSEQCVSAPEPNRTSPGDYTEFIDVTLPAAAGAHSVLVRFYNNNNNPSTCTSGSRISGANATANFTIAAAPPARATVTLADTTDSHTPIASGTSLAPGAVIDIKVVYKVGVTDWNGTRWEFADGQGSVVGAACVGTGGNGSSGQTYTEYLRVAVPEPTGTYTVRAHLYSTSDCSGSEIIGSTAASFPTVAVLKPTANPTLNLGVTCDSRVLLVLDESGSISQSDAVDDVRAGAKAFVNGLLNTPVQIGVLEFNAQARKVQISGNDYNLATPGYATAFANYVDAKASAPSPRYNPDDYSGDAQYTNWAAALTTAFGYSATKPDLVVFLTDGDPTAYGTGSNPTTGLANGSSLAMNPAFAAAEALRGAGIKSFGLGVGTAVSSAESRVRLRAVSGPLEFRVGDSMVQKDWTVVNDFSSLQSALAELAFDLCAVHVKVVKQVDADGDGTYAPAEGWRFTGKVASPAPSGTSYRWLLPGPQEGPTPPPTTSRTASTVGSAGAIVFSWRSLPDLSATSQIVLSDDGLADGAHPNHHFVSVVCTNDKPGAPAPAVTPAGGAATITVGGLKTNDNITCTFRNQINQATLTVVKKFDGQPTEVSLFVNDLTAKKTGNTESFTTGPLKVAPTVAPAGHTVWEEFTSTAAQALYDSSYSCTNGASGTGTGPFTVPVPPAANVTCTFTNTKSTRPTVRVAKSADPIVLFEPGGTTTFTVGVVNTSAGAVTLRSLVDDQFGDITSDGGRVSDTTCSLGVTLAADDGDDAGGPDTYSCSFRGLVVGEAGLLHKDTVTAEVEDETGEKATDDADATVKIVDRLPTIDLTKSAEPNLIQDSGTVVYTAVITNTSVVDPLRVDRLVDSIYGDLISGPVHASCTYAGEPIDLPHVLPYGESLICRFQAIVATTQTDTITVSGTDNEGNRVDAAAAAGVMVLTTTPPPTPPSPPAPPPPPPPPSPEPGAASVALAVHKTARANVFRNADGRATFAYDIRVSNRGSHPAPNTILRDRAPLGARFVLIVNRPSQGSCAISGNGRLLLCRLGTIVKGQSVGVEVTVRVAPSTAPRITNTALATCQPVRAATCTATGLASTRLLAPFAPPPTCDTVAVRPRSLRANGERQALAVTVHRGGRAVMGVTVVATGPGIRTSARTGPRGNAVLALTPTTPGVLTIRLRGARACTAATRVGIESAGAVSPLTG